MFENKQFKSNKSLFFLLENFKMEKLLSLLWLKKSKFRKNETVKIPFKKRVSFVLHEQNDAFCIFYGAHFLRASLGFYL